VSILFVIGTKKGREKTNWSRRSRRVEGGENVK